MSPDFWHGFWLGAAVAAFAVPIAISLGALFLVEVSRRARPKAPGLNSPTVTQLFRDKDTH